MRYKILSLIAAVALVAACETAGEGGGAKAGGGAKPTETFTTPLGMIKPGSQEDLVVNVGDRVFFDFDKFNLKPDARKTLEKQAAWLKANPDKANFGVPAVGGHVAMCHLYDEAYEGEQEAGEQCAVSG